MNTNKTLLILAGAFTMLTVVVFLFTLFRQDGAGSDTIQTQSENVTFLSPIDAENIVIALFEDIFLAQDGISNPDLLSRMYTTLSLETRQNYTLETIDEDILQFINVPSAPKTASIVDVDDRMIEIDVTVNLTSDEYDVERRLFLIDEGGVWRLESVR